MNRVAVSCHQRKDYRILWFWVIEVAAGSKVKVWGILGGIAILNGVKRS